ncbi:MAG TPA: hypothetical protein VN641_12670, partial [Urbifossiella sp.]|nr:hypothetical protein [Urbifossiella sp.]
MAANTRLIAEILDSFAAIKNWRPLFLFRGSRAFAVSAMMPVPFATFFASPQRGRAAIIHL